MSAQAHIQKELRDLLRHSVGGFTIEAEDLMKWTIYFLGPPDSLYEGGCYRATLKFPQDYPYSPPRFTINSSFWHPNVYYGDDKSGDVCISILHAPGVDEQNSIETASMRWTPIQSIEKVLISIVSLLSDPDSSDAGAPANVDALVQFRKDKAGFIRRCKENASRSLQELPKGFQLPKVEDAKPVMEAQRGPSFMMAEDSTDYDFGLAEEEDSVESKISEIKNMGLGGGKTDEQLAALVSECNMDMERITNKLLGL